MDVSKLQAAKAALDAHFAALIAAASGGTAPDQATIDTLTAEVQTVDADVVSAGGSTGSGLNFSMFNAAVAKLSADAVAFAADAKVTQGSVDGLTAQIVMVDAAVVAGTV